MCRGSRPVFVGLVCSIAFALGAVPARAANLIDTPRSNKIVITVPIDLIGGEDDVAKRWNKAIKKYWNNGPWLGYFKYCGKKVELDPDIQPIASGQAGRSNAHKITMRLVREGEFYRSNVVWPGSFDPAKNAGGTWSSNASDATVAHEFGHLLGLALGEDEEYFYEDRNNNDRRDLREPTHPEPEFRDGSVMAEPNGKVLQRHINEAMRKNGVTGCEEWVGWIEWTYVWVIRNPSYPYSIVSTGRADLTVSHDGQGNLTGEMAGEDHLVKAVFRECESTEHTPVKVSAKLIGQYTPGRRTISLTMTERRAEGGSAVSSCNPKPTPYTHTHEGGMLSSRVLEEVLRTLTMADDGSVRISREGAGPMDGSTLITELTLRRLE